MRSHWFKLRIGLLLGVLSTCFAQVGSDDVFTISVTAPTSPKDLQVRYFLTDGSGPDWYTTAAEVRGDRFVVKTVVAEKPATSFKALVYAPGCQFMTIAVDDLTSSNREAEFQCQSLPTTSFQGTVLLPPGDPKEYNVEALYVCDWAHQVFDIPQIAVSPLAIGRAKVGSDGSFSMDLPDFTQDRLWPSLTYNSALTFVLADAASGRRWPMKGPGDSSRRPLVKVASVYPGKFDFSVQF